MKSSGTGKSISTFAVVVAITAVVLAGCDSAGAGGGGGTSGGSYDITFEVSGSYTPNDSGPIPYNLLVSYSYATASQGSVTAQEQDPALPLSETVTLEAGTGVSLSATLVDGEGTGSVTYTLKQNGTVIESHQYSDDSVGYTISHTVGQ